MTDRVSIIIRETAFECGITPELLVTKTHMRCIARPRQIAMTIAREITKHSLPALGKRFGGTHHTTILWASKQIAKLRETDADFEALFWRCYNLSRAAIELWEAARRPQVADPVPVGNMSAVKGQLMILRRQPADVQRERIGGKRATASGRAAA